MFTNSGEVKPVVALRAPKCWDYFFSTWFDFGLSGQCL